MTDRADQAAKSGPGLLTMVRVRGFRTLRDATFRPGALSALVGEPGTGKSNLLAAIRAALDPESTPLTRDDLARAGSGPLLITVEIGDGTTLRLEGRPPELSRSGDGNVPPVIYLPAHLRSVQAIAPASQDGHLPRMDEGHFEQVTQLADSGQYPPGAAEAAHGLVAAIDGWTKGGLTGMVVLVEEPELFLPVQTQRYLYRLLRRLAAQGNQILYSTHSPAFLNVARLHELVLTRHDAATGTRLVQPEPLPADEEFRAYSEFDATRSELFLARAAVLVEGQTERLALPFVFQALGYDPDQEQISIIECGGKPNIPLIARVARRVGVPFVAVHDRDAPRRKKPIEAEQRLNRLIGQIAGAHRVELIPDFEGVAGLKGHAHKPARAWRSFAGLKAEDIPEPLARIAKMAVDLARS